MNNFDPSYHEMEPSKLSFWKNSLPADIRDTLSDRNALDRLADEIGVNLTPERVRQIQVVYRYLNQEDIAHLSWHAEMNAHADEHQDKELDALDCYHLAVEADLQSYLE